MTEYSTCRGYAARIDLGFRGEERTDVKALVKVALGKGNLELRDVPVPVVGPGEVVMRVAATGVCGTDLHVEDDEYVVVPPVTIGHETSGRIVDLGVGVTGLSIGDRVTAMTTMWSCGVCTYCRADQLNLCPQRRGLGAQADGAFATYLRLPAKNALRLPDNVPDVPASLTEPLACCTHAVFEVGGLDTMARRHDAPIIVAGPGPIGLLCAQVTRAAGHRVVILGTGADATRFAIARALGFQDLIDVTASDPIAMIGAMTAGAGAPVVIEAAGAPQSLATAIELVRRGGLVIQVGLYGKSVPVPVDRLVIREVTLRGSFASTPSSWKSALDLMATGAVDLAPLVSQVLPLEDWATGFAGARAKAAGKVVLIPGD
jgi:L-iditol 2-dehydrogenase